MNMNNDDRICKKLLKALNKEFDTKYKFEQFMEWTTSEIDFHEGEKIYKLSGDFKGINVAIKL